MAAPLLYAAGVAGATALTYGSQAVASYLNDPKNATDNLSRYFSGSSASMDQAPTFWSGYQPSARDTLAASIPNPVTQQKNQFQQLQDNRYLRSQGIQTGFDDEADNTIDDRARAKLESQQRANMATPNSNATNANQRTNIYSNKSSDYAPTEKLQSDYAGYQIRSLTDLQNYQMQSSDRRYNIDRTSEVNYALGSQKNQVDYEVGMNRNAVTRDVGYYTSDNQLRASNYKTLADLQANLYKSQLQSGDNRYATDTQASTEKFKWTTVNPTSIAEAQIKAGTYGLSQNQLSKAAADKTNFDNWKNYNDAMFNYTNQMNAQMKLSQDIGQAQRAYNDQRNDRSNDQSLAMSRYNAEQAQKAVERQRYYDDLAQQRQLQRDDFNLRSRQIQNQIDIANKDYQIRYGDAKLRQDQFAATRADISYNRGNQSSSLAF